MTRRARDAALITVAAAITVAALAYLWWSGVSRVSPVPVTAGGRSVVEPLPLPDLARLDAPVQQQVRDRHAALAKALETGATAPAELAEAFGAVGTLLLAAEYPAEAETAFLNAETLAPSDMRWPYYLGHVYRARQQPARAIPMFERVLTLAPDDVASLIWLGDLHLTNGDATAAEPHLQRAVTLQPDSAPAVFRLGRVALARRDYSRAIEHLERALHLKPDALSVHYPLGMAYRGAGRLAQAEAHLHRSSDSGGIDPADPLMDVVAALLENPGAYEARGMEALEARNWTAAVENLRTAVALAPRNAVTRLNLGMAFSLSGDSAAARNELLEAVRLAPELAKAHFGLGLLAQDAGQWDEAIERFSAAVRYEPGFVDAHFTLADALRRTGRAEQSLPHYAQVLQLNGAASQARFGYAMALVRLRRYGAARSWLTEAVQLHPDQPGLPHALARILAAAPDPNARDGHRALALMQPLVAQQRSAAANETMAMVLAELGRFDEAAAWQQRAIAAARAAGQPALAARMQDNIALYRRGEPCRTPWREDDPVMTAVRTP